MGFNFYGTLIKQNIILTLFPPLIVVVLRSQVPKLSITLVTGAIAVAGATSASRFPWIVYCDASTFVLVLKSINSPTLQFR
ncbi:hypothetical protein SLEP1_g57533 [Rubroshorea leprosula]|uniref:NADH dehydrogenase subunit 2 n=1 Tax=Rubroshorea leprosula TaxID=152421 RepID=A0AAV5MMS6_9ROSI|nr:hypothetical protein SLEP1_g57533 [Rubroshorea leprosula]